jgi:hypothetical protein
MEMPHGEILAPTAVREAVGEELRQVQTIAVYGKAEGLERLRGFERLESLWISGVNARAAEVVAQLPRLTRIVAHDWRVADLSALRPLTNLREVAICGSGKLKSLAGLEALGALRKLILFDDVGYSSIEQLRHLGAIEELVLEGGFSKQLRVTSLEPLTALAALRRLRLASLRGADGSLRPLHDLQALREVFICKNFSAEEFRALARALPLARGDYLDSYRGTA